MLRMVWETLAVVTCGLSLPLFADLFLAVAGNGILALRGGRGGNEASSWGGQLGVVIPAHNEAQMIAGTVQSVAASADGAVPILVVAHNCTDGTAEAARGAGAQVLELKDDGRAGKSAALRAGFLEAKAMGCTAFAVVDADSTVSAGFVRAMQRGLAAGAQALQCRYEQDGGVATADRLRMLAFRGMNVVRGRGRAAWGCSSGIFGNGFVLTAALLDKVPYMASSIAEDAEHHAAMVAHGERVWWVEDARVTAPLAATRAAHDSQEARWEGGRLRVGLSVAPQLLGALLRGNLQAAEALVAALSLPFSLGVVAAIVCLSLPVGWSRIYGIGCVMVSLLYLATAAQLGEHPAREWRALLAAPAFVVRKLLLLPRIVTQAGKGAAWVRTGRERGE